MLKPIICQIALPIPLRRLFDYQLPLHLAPNSLISLVGRRVRVSFGSKREMIGLIYSTTNNTAHDLTKIKPIIELLDTQPLLSSNLWDLLHWASLYYQHPFGDVLQQALPSALRKGKEATFKMQEYWHLLSSDLNISEVKRAKKQYQALLLLKQNPLSTTHLKAQGITRNTLNILQEKGFIECIAKQPEYNLNWSKNLQESEDKPQLSTEQAVAITAVNQQNKEFNCFLLEGITGSGKTEVYLNILTPILKMGKQVLIIVPEIGLTPQIIQRFQARFNLPIYLKHSGLNSRQQLDTWCHAKQGSAAIIIGTRSAIFSDIKNLGLIILDEEHDASFKQQDGFRYHARDFAIKRAHMENIPIILGSATPALETLHNALQGKYQHLHLTQRAGLAKPPTSSLINLAGLPLQSGLSPQLIELMRRHLQKNNQVILFLNRRGFSPVLMCHECGWLVKCTRCDAFYTYHKKANYLHCHHCASTLPIPQQCYDCGSTQLITNGVGTEQLEQTLKSIFPDDPVIRIDRDNTRKKESFDEYLNDIHQGKYKILIGTQMLAKGHHFPNVTLVALIDVDGALFCNDFRASERLAQLFTQVAGRAGRAEKKGQVVLQTHHPEHILLQELVNSGYTQFSRNALRERKLAQLPPYQFQALLRAESENATLAENFLTLCRQILIKICLEHNITEKMLLLGPIPAPMERKAGRYRFQLLLQSTYRTLITQTLQRAIDIFSKSPEGRKVKWSIDVDPIDFT
ncbi:primosomal protein N' [Psychromonas sp. CD1]|uniref:primosomal protein N' n=1 Tax=Psychromonas sp. CD1 TaxID=1979839 RepID=UPI000B9BB357|nr:primosomal protein N' [Psychromonas sp. CD1]